MCCTSDNHNYMCHTCAKEFFKFKLKLRSYWQNIKFSRYCPKFHIFTNIVIFQVFLQHFRPTASSLLISWQGHVRNTLFHFCQLPPVKIEYMWVCVQNLMFVIVILLILHTYLFLSLCICHFFLKNHHQNFNSGNKIHSYFNDIENDFKGVLHH